MPRVYDLCQLEEKELGSDVGPSEKGRKGKGGPNPIDAHVGSRVRLRRTILGISQGKLAKTVDLTFQQIQKYERGSNRIGASRLYQLSQALDVPVSFFYDEMPENAQDFVSGITKDPKELFQQDQLARRETLELVRAYYKIPDPAVRRRMLGLAKALGKISEH